MGCREEVLIAAKDIVGKKGENEFTLQEILNFMQKKGTGYADSTIRTHVTSRCCGNAPKNHETKYDDFRRVGRGKYKLSYP